MPPNLTIIEDDLISFLGSNPETDEPDIPWLYRVTEYSHDQGNRRISFSIYPACSQVCLVIYVEGKKVLHLSAEAVQDVRIFSAKGQEQLEIITSERDLILSCLLPEITVFQELHAASRL